MAGIIRRSVTRTGYPLLGSSGQSTPHVTGDTKLSPSGDHATPIPSNPLALTLQIGRSVTRTGYPLLGSSGQSTPHVTGDTKLSPSGDHATPIPSNPLALTL